MLNNGEATPANTPPDDLPPEFLLEVNRACEEYEAAWHSAECDGRPRPEPGPFAGRVATPAQGAAGHYLRRLRAELEGPLGYEVLGELGRGGMGVVFRARRADGTEVALKRLHAAERERNDRQRALWEAEGEIVAGLSHPNVVPVTAFFEHHGEHYLVMPLIAGDNLRNRLPHYTLADADLSPADRGRRAMLVAALLEKVARAMHYVHQRGVFHRDLKPANILIDAAGEPRVCDFGLARRVAEPLHITLSGQMVGTVPYMAPEQLRSGEPLTTAVDIWALGAILYELLTGRVPLTEGDPDLFTLVARKAERDPEPPSAARPDLPGDADLDWVCTRCLRRDPNERFASAAELAEALARYQKGQRVRDQESIRQVVRRWLRPITTAPVQPDYIGRWKHCMRREAATSLACHVGMFFLARLHPPGLWVWLWFVLFDTLTGWAVWYRLMLQRALKPMEQQVAHLWLSADLAIVVLLTLACPPWQPLDPPRLAWFYATYAVVRGLIIFIEGRMCWGRLYLASLLFYAGAALMMALPEYAPLLHGGLFSGWMAWMSFRRWEAPCVGPQPA